jgi:hypothetical protein
VRRVVRTGLYFGDLVSEFFNRAHHCASTVAHRSIGVNCTKGQIWSSRQGADQEIGVPRNCTKGQISGNCRARAVGYGSCPESEIHEISCTGKLPFGRGKESACDWPS